jgi:protein-tyrosine phosphatase
MKYAILFGLLGLALLYLAWGQPAAGVVLAWAGVAFLVMAAAYAGLGVRVLGKRADGSLPGWSRAVLFPYLLSSWGLWEAQRRLRREGPCSRIAPGLWLGRRPFADELPPEVRLVVDLTAEFPVAPGVTAGRGYLCVPSLDASVPELEAFSAAVQAAAACEGEVYLHCAVGRGRSATLAAAVLVAKGLAPDVEEAERQIRLARPQIGINQEQRRLLARWEKARD